MDSKKPTHEYFNLKQKTKDSGTVTLKKIRKTLGGGGNPPKPNRSLRDLVIEGFANINARLENLEKFTVEQRQFNKNTNKRLSRLEATVSSLDARVSSLDATVSNVIKINKLKTK